MIYTRLSWPLSFTTIREGDVRGDFRAHGVLVEIKWWKPIYWHGALCFPP